MRAASGPGARTQGCEDRSVEHREAMRGAGTRLSHTWAGIGTRPRTPSPRAMMAGEIAPGVNHG